MTARTRISVCWQALRRARLGVKGRQKDQNGAFYVAERRLGHFGQAVSLKKFGDRALAPIDSSRLPEQ